jgi:hypothetical protein
MNYSFKNKTQDKPDTKLDIWIDKIIDWFCVIRSISCIVVIIIIVIAIIGLIL